MFIEPLFYRIISPDRKFYHVPVYLILRAFGYVYGWGNRFRTWAYDGGLFSRRRLNCRVISVGNLTLGGTGKTPMVMMIAETLKGNGHKPAILSRGYGGSSKKEINVVCDGQKVLLTPEEVGDEPVMIAERLKNVPVLTGRDRYQAGRYAIDHFGVDTLILDDGYQHLALFRDLNILLFDYQKPFGNGQIFPAGELREQLQEIRRADIICFTRYSGNGKQARLEGLVSDGIPVVKTALRLDSLIDNATGEALDPEFLSGEPVAAFCGIAKPANFRQILEQAKMELAFFQAFPDHHKYSPNDLKALDEQAIKSGAKYILVSEKDAVKLKGASFKLPLLKVFVKLEILEGREVFTQTILFSRRNQKVETHFK